MDDAACAGSAAFAGVLLVGSRLGTCGCDGEVSGYHASVFGIYHGSHVSDAGDLSDGDAAGMADGVRYAQSYYQYCADVPQCDAL